MDQLDQGYEDKRFQYKVDGNFHCPICLNVLKNPVQCRRNEHYFCMPCIVRHLEQNSQNCPVCVEPLTTRTLKEPSRIVVNYLSKLKIACDFAKEGCHAVVELADLKAHVDKCEYTPVPCSIDGCPAFIPRRDKKQHETQLCQFRKTKCRVCGKRVQHKKYESHGCVLKKAMAELREEVADAKDEVSQLRELARKSNDRQIAQDKTIREMNKTIAELREELSKLRGQPSEAVPKRDIIVAGGHDGSSYLNSVEMFRCATKIWVSLPPMNQRRLAPSSFVYQNNFIVSGGFAGNASTDNMERMNLSQEPKQWFDFRAKLPFKGNRHTCVIYENRLIVIGGEDSSKILDDIYEILIASPSTTQLRGRLPQPRVGHSAVLHNDKVLIVGGRTSNRFKDSISSVVLFDISERKCKDLEPLPYELSQMATVCRGDNLLIIGGQDKEGNVLNKFFVYNITTGKSKFLPNMNARREAPTAVISGNGVVVMGGRDEQKRYLKSVEFFSFDRQVWEELPHMNTPRMYAASSVIP